MTAGQADPATEAAVRGATALAQQIIGAQARAGMTADRIAEHHREVSEALLNGADSRTAAVYAMEYGLQGEGLIEDLRYAERTTAPQAGRGAAAARPEPERTPGAPHPDPARGPRP